MHAGCMGPALVEAPGIKFSHAQVLAMWQAVFLALYVKLQENNYTEWFDSSSCAMQG